MSAGNETVQKAKIITTRWFSLRLIFVFVVQPYLTFDLMPNRDFSKKKNLLEIFFFKTGGPIIKNYLLLPA